MLQLPGIPSKAFRAPEPWTRAITFESLNKLQLLVVPGGQTATAWVLPAMICCCLAFGSWQAPVVMQQPGGKFDCDR